MFTHERPGSPLALAAVLGLVCFAPLAALAAPGKSNCKELHPTDPFARLACREQAIATQVTYLSDEMFRPGTVLHDRTRPERLTHIRNAKESAVRSARIHGKDAFKKASSNEVLGRKGGGHLVPMTEADDADGDGICDWEQGRKTASCAPIEPAVDASGKPVACNPEKKNKGKGKDGLECDRLMDPESTDSADLVDAAEDLDRSYDVAEDNLIEMNQSLEYVNGNVSRAVQVRSDPTSPACNVPTVAPGLSDAVSALRATHAALFSVARVGADIGGQDAMGWNARGVAVKFDVIAGIANLAYITCEEVLKHETGAVQTAIMDCVSKTANEIAALKEQITREHLQIQTNDNANTATIMGQVEDVRREVVDLLNTPQGQRPMFPLK